MFRALVHLLGALQFSYSVYYDWNYVHIPGGMPNGSKFGGKLIFLTFWNAVIQSLFFWLCLLNDFIGSNEINPKVTPTIRKFKDILFCSIAFPLSAFVATTFWGLYAINRELVLPKVLDLYFPTWLNHIMHTNILIFSLIELITTGRIYPEKKQGLTILTLFMLVYLCWIFIVYSKSEEWVYPVLTVLNWPQRILFFVGLLLLVQGFYVIGDILNSMIWGKLLTTVSAKKKLQKEKMKKKF